MDKTQIDQIDEERLNAWASKEVSSVSARLKFLADKRTVAVQSNLEKVLDALVGNKASVATRESFRKRLRSGDLDKNEIEIDINEASQMPQFEIPGMPGANVGMINISEMLDFIFE